MNSTVTRAVDQRDRIETQQRISITSCHGDDPHREVQNGGATHPGNTAKIAVTM